MTAYRDTFGACPECGSTLREFNHRLVCDQCCGMMLPEASLEEAVHALDKRKEPLAASDVQDGGPACPRCGNATQ